MYLTLTMVLIALEAFLGAGGKNGLTLNRIVATISGVLMAIIISFLPPHVNGRDPEHTRDYVNALNDAFMLLLRTFADENESSRITSDDARKTFLSTAKKKRQFAAFVLNDADMLRFLPFLRVNEKLRSVLEMATVTEAMIYHLLDGFSNAITKGIHVNMTRNIVSYILSELEAGGGKLLEKKPDAALKSDITIAWTYDIVWQLNKLEVLLDQIESE